MESLKLTMACYEKIKDCYGKSVHILRLSSKIAAGNTMGKKRRNIRPARGEADMRARISPAQGSYSSRWRPPYSRQPRIQGSLSSSLKKKKKKRKKGMKREDPGNEVVLAAVARRSRHSRF